MPDNDAGDSASSADAWDIPDRTTSHVQDVMRRFRQGQYSDFIIKCGDDEYLVHKAIICARSTFFDRVCSSGFKVGLYSQQDFLKLKLTSLTGSHGNYSHTILKPSGDYHSGSVLKADFLPLHAKAYILGDKYGMPGLQKTAMDNAIATTKTYSNCVLSEAFKESLDIIYEQSSLQASSCGFRGCLVDAMVSHQTCLDDDNIANKIRRHPDLCYEVGTKLRKDYKRTCLSIECSRCRIGLNLAPECLANMSPTLTGDCNDGWGKCHGRHQWVPVSKTNHREWNKLSGRLGGF